MNRVDLADVAIIVGVLVLGIGIFMAYGAAGVVGYVGGALIVIGLMVAAKPADKKDSEGAG